MKNRLAILLLSCIVSACSQKPSPPPAPLPGVETVDTITVQAPQAPSVKKAPAQPFRNVYFAFDSDTLRPGQVRQLARLRAWAESQSVTLTCTGYADTTGATEYNLALSLRRANAVAARVPCRVEAHGETVQFGADKANRRVTIKPDTTKK